MTLYENEILKCRVNGLPPAHVTWIHNKVIVHNETSVAVLEIPKVDENHEKTYGCGDEGGGGTKNCRSTFLLMSKEDSQIFQVLLT